MTIDKDGLAPCPFCGGRLETGVLSLAHNGKYVRHNPSDCAVPDTALILVESWNRRALPNTGDELVARLRAATMTFDWAELPDDAAIPAVPLLREAADHIENVHLAYRAENQGALMKAEAAILRAQAAEASLASAREDALNAALGVALAELALMTELAGKWRDEGEEAAMDRVNSAARSADRIAAAIRALKGVQQ